MKVRVLGCSGGIGTQRRTTSLLVDNDILVDAGTGVGDLDLAAMLAIDHLFLTHSHLDHITALPLMLDTVGNQRNTPFVVHALAETIDILKTHIFNHKVWPDFTQIPTPEAPFLKFEPLLLDTPNVIGGRRFQAIPVDHTVPAVGYIISGDHASLAFSGDTGPTVGFWRALNQCQDIKDIIIETTFLDQDREICELSRHLCPALLTEELKKIEQPARLWITHLMPGQEAEIVEEIRQQNPHLTFHILARDDSFEL